MICCCCVLMLLSLLEGGPPRLPRPKTTNHDSRTDDVPGGRTEGPAQEEVPVTPPGRPLRAQSISHKRAKAQASPVPQNLMRMPLPKGPGAPRPSRATIARKARGHRAPTELITITRRDGPGQARGSPPRWPRGPSAETGPPERRWGRTPALLACPALTCRSLPSRRKSRPT